jgi:hypothetical protein
LWEDFSNQPYEAALKRVLDTIFDVDVRPPLGKPRSGRTPEPGPPPMAPKPDDENKHSTRKFPIYMADLHWFAAELTLEGFDAKSDLYNGQLGLIVGPKGLDPKRLPPETAGLFFPLWELNHPANRPLVAARKFHEVFENRPSDWQFNRPYQQKGTALPPSRDKRNWSRSASLLGNPNLEHSIQQELTRRFPVTGVPVNINVVGDQGNTWAMVQINDFDTGIDEKVKAVPEDFLGRGGLMAAVLTTAQNMIAELQKTGRLPLANQREGDKNVQLQSKCPNCGKPTSHTLQTDELATLLDTDELKLYCIQCDHHWKPGSEERSNLARWLDSKLE